MASTSASNSGSRSAATLLNRGALALDRGLVSARDRSGQRPLGPEPRPSSRRWRARAGRQQLAVDPGGAATRSAAASSVIRKFEAIDAAAWYAARSSSATATGRMPSACAIRARNPARAGCCRRSPRRRRRNWLPSAVTVINGCSENASCVVSAPRPVAPEQWPTSGPRAMCEAAWRDLAVGHAQQHRIGACAVGTATPSGRIRHSRRVQRRRQRGTHTALPNDGQARTRRGVRGGFPFQFPHLRYRSAAKGKFKVRGPPAMLRDGLCSDDTPGRGSLRRDSV